ncbi:MAG: Transcriptional repressor RcnR to maintain nickel and cobalt homeostasis [Candidatus Moranbacteria bacterium GW2011_GWC2_37_8]|nr:MAG: Transcriptional repressor RcnR to maintain nickel and cobalt homeostasis [Candidatus Moranbacteria bacterium GW2011_GWC2_37_8]KKQ63358.1 MAG: Transcriptional repressor RcnR to maintain nickel and cobalt homeostasis [Parcubacteria group bacterium GW2011_GWC1_38_22]
MENKKKSCPEKLLNRVSRIEGQVRGLKKMLESGSGDCNKVIAQVLAVREAVASLGAEILQEELVCKISDRKKIDEKQILKLLKMR